MNGLRCSKRFNSVLSVPDRAMEAEDVSSERQPGTFYLVGMGTAPDLITLRALDVISRSEIVLVHDGLNTAPYAAHLAGKETWIVPHNLRVFYGTDLETIEDPAQRELATQNDCQRRALVDKTSSALHSGKSVASLQAGDPMMFGALFLLEMLPVDIQREIVPGVGSFQAATAAVQQSPSFGYDTSSVILTMADWPGRADINEKLMGTGTSMAFYAMHLDLPALFSRLARHYPLDTPVAAVIDAGDRARQSVLRSTVGHFFDEVSADALSSQKYLLFVGKFLSVGQARKDGVQHNSKLLATIHGQHAAT